MILTKIFNIYRGFPKSIYVLFFARTVNCLGSFVYMFLTFFLTKNLGISEDTTGIIVMATIIVSMLGSLVGGKVADARGRKACVVIFQLLSATCFLMCAIFNSSIVLILLLIAAWFFIGAVEPADTAMMMDLTTEENRKPAFSLLYLGINIGFSIGPLIAGFLYNSHLRLIFIGDAFTTLISVILVIIFVKETIPKEDRNNTELKKEERPEKGSTIAALSKRPALLMFAIIFIMYSFVYSQHNFSTPLYVNSLFGIDGPGVFGTIMTVNALCVVFLTTPVIGFTRKIEPIVNMIIGGVLYAIGFGVLYFLKSRMLIVLSTIVWTIGEIMNTTNEGVYIASHTPISHRGRFNAIVPIIISGGYALGPALTGRFIKFYGIINTWLLTFVVGIAAAFFMYLLYICEKRVKSRDEQLVFKQNI